MAWTEIEEVRRRLVGLRFDLALLRLSLLELKYRPDQPRAPPGQPDGGQWIDDGSGGASAGAQPDDGVFRPGSDADPALTQAAQPSRQKVDLRTEGSGGKHAIDKHVAKSNAQLKTLLEEGDFHDAYRDGYALEPVGSYDSIGAANAYTNAVIDAHADQVEAVASGRVPRAYLYTRFDSPTGREIDRKVLFFGRIVNVFQPTFAAAVVIDHVPGGKGYRVATSFPMNKKPNKD